MGKDYLLNEGFDLSQEGWRLEQVGELGFISSSTSFEVALLGLEIKGVFLLGFSFGIVVDGLYLAY